jgi:hypothetical protein
MNAMGVAGTAFGDPPARGREDQPFASTLTTGALARLRG